MAGYTPFREGSCSRPQLSRCVHKPRQRAEGIKNIRQVSDLINIVEFISLEIFLSSNMSFINDWNI